MEKDEKLIPSLEEAGSDVTPVCEEDACNAAEEAEAAEVTENCENTKEIEESSVNGLSEVDESKIIHADGNFDYDQWIDAKDEAKAPANKLVKSVYEFLEMLAVVTVVIVLCFSFVFRLNIVDGPSMEDTLHTGEYLLVSDLFYEPTPGDVVVVHDMTAGHYTDPIVKRVIAVEGQTVDIDFSTWTLKVDGKIVDESSYRKLADHLLTSNMQFPLTVPENSVFVMGDNRNHSADSRLEEIGMIDERCIVGKVYARIFPFDTFKLFSNPYND